MSPFCLKSKGCAGNLRDHSPVSPKSLAEPWTDAVATRGFVVVNQSILCAPAVPSGLVLGHGGHGERLQPATPADRPQHVPTGRQASVPAHTASPSQLPERVAAPVWARHSG